MLRIRQLLALASSAAAGLGLGCGSDGRGDGRSPTENTWVTGGTAGASPLVAGGHAIAGLPGAGGTPSNGGANRGGALGTAAGGSAGSSFGMGGGLAEGGSGGDTSAGGTPAGGSPPEDAGVESADSGTDADGMPCDSAGNITYTLAREAVPTADQQAAYDRIEAAMDTAVRYYNCYTNIEKALRVSYVPSVATADGNPNGSIRFGSTASMNHVTAMHEISHTVGVGDTAFDALIVDGIFTGENATNQLRAITGNPTDQVHGDLQHFWPFGLNYESEAMSEEDLIHHCKMVVAIRADMGL